MNCETYLSLLDDYTDGALSPEQKQQMEAHAAACPACRDRMILLEDLRALSRQDTVPDHFAFAWRSRIRAEKRRIQPALRSLMSAAAALVFLAGGTLWHRSQSAVGQVTENAPMMRSMDAAAGAAVFARKVASPTRWEQVMDFFRDMGQFLLAALPYLAAAAVLTVLFLTLKKRLKNRKE